MKDGELRGLLLRALYDRRRMRSDEHPEPGFTDFRDEVFCLVEGIPFEEQKRLLFQLAQARLVELWAPKSSQGLLLLGAWISSQGIDVVEGNRPAPIAITLHATNAQIGDGNTLHARTADDGN